MRRASLILGWSFLTHMDAEELAGWPPVFPVLARRESWVKPGALAVYVPLDLNRLLFEDGEASAPMRLLRRLAEALPTLPYRGMIAARALDRDALFAAVHAADVARTQAEEDRTLGIRPLARW